MSMKKVEQFFKLIEGNEVLAKRLAKINEELKSESEEFLNCEQAINEKIIPFAEENGISFTAKDFLDYTNSKLPPELTREDLLNVSGGVSPKTFAITLGALLTLPFASGSLMSFADDGKGSSAPQQVQTQAATQNAANDEAEKPQKAKPYESLWLSDRRSVEAVKDNMLKYLSENNIKNPNQIENLPAFTSDLGKIFNMIKTLNFTVSEDGTVKLGEKSWLFNGELQNSKQGQALKFLKELPQKLKAAVPNYYTPLSVKEENEGKMSLDERLDYLYEVVKFVQSIKDLPEGFNLGDLIWDIENLLDEVKETHDNSYKVQHLRNIYDEYKEVYSARNFIPSPEGASLEEQINNVYDFISSSSTDVTKETEEALKNVERVILMNAIDPNTGEIRKDFYINLVGKENFERILKDLEKISDQETWREKMKKLNKEENNFASKLEKIKKHYDSNYAVQYLSSARGFEKLSPIQQLHDLYPVVSMCESIFDVHKNTVEALKKNIEMFIGETWNAKTKMPEISGTLNAETLQELNAVQKFAEESGIPLIAKLNKMPNNNSKMAEIFDSLLKTSRRINTINDLSDKDAKKYKGWAELLARYYYNPRQETFEVPGAEDINGKQIIDVCKKSGIKLKVADNNQVTRKDDITGRFNRLAWVLNRASSVDDLADVEATKKELQDLVNEFYNAKGERFEIPITESREGKLLEVGSTVPENGETIINECKRLGIELKIDFRKLPEGLADNQKFLYVEEIAKRINSTDDLTKDGKKAFESAGTELIKKVAKNRDNPRHKEIYNKSCLKRVYENSKDWPIIYFSPDKEMSQMGKIDYFEKVLKIYLKGRRKSNDPKDLKENVESKTDGQDNFISDVLKLGDTHYNEKTGKFEITDGSYDKVTDEGKAKIDRVKRFYEILIKGDSNNRIEKTELNEYNSSSWTLVRTAQALVDQLKEQDWNWAKFSPETLPSFISDLRKVVSKIERGGNELYYLNNAWFGTNENTSIESKDLEKLKEVLADYNSWL